MRPPTLAKPVLLLLLASVALPAADTALLLEAGRPILSLDLPSGWKAWPVTGGVAKIETPTKAPHLVLSQVVGVPAPAAAESSLKDLVTSEVTAFTPTSTDRFTVAGQPALHVVGTGTEADDGDPSNAEAFLFTVGGRTFLLLAHGEGDGAATHRAALLALLATSK